MIYKTILFQLLLILSFSSHINFKDCNFTDFRFQSQYNLGKQDQLNITFDAIAPKISIPDINYPINSYTNYSLTGVKASLQYLDSGQKAQIWGNDTIMIDGGYLQALIDMKWSRKDFMQRGGSLQVVCKSSQVMFIKNMTIQRGFLLYQITAYFNITFVNDCTIVRYDPANTSELDLSYIRQLLNKRDDGKQTAKSLLQSQIAKYYLYQLNNSLYNQKHQLDNKFVYQWNDPIKKTNLSIQYQVLPTGVDLEKEGLSFTFVTEIKDYDTWECGSTIPHTNLDIKTYGGIQQIVSLSVFKNTLKYAIERRVLDTVLNNQNWSSQMFQFYAGDLYEVIPSISQKYRARQQIIGGCQAVPDKIAITPEQKINELLVYTSHVCSLYIQGTTKILDLKIDLYTHIEVKFEEQGKVNFYIKAFSHNLSYVQQPLFKIKYYSLVNEIVSSSLNRLINTKTFGSGWPIFKMDYPHLKIMPAEYIVFYDTSHIGNYQQKKQ